MCRRQGRVACGASHAEKKRMKSLARNRELGAGLRTRQRPMCLAHPSASVTSLGRRRRPSEGCGAKRNKTSSSSWEVGAPSSAGGRLPPSLGTGHYVRPGGRAPTKLPSAFQHRPTIDAIRRTLLGVATATSEAATIALLVFSGLSDLVPGPRGSGCRAPAGESRARRARILRGEIPVVWAVRKGKAV